MTRTRSAMASTTAALLALLMLSFASVQSAVMRASMSPLDDMGPMCGAPAMAMTLAAGEQQAAMSMGPAHRHGDGAAHHAACPYCAAAAHAPIMGHQPPLRHATGFVFAAFRVVASHGPRGPPAPQPRARGPPSPPLFV